MAGPISPLREPSPLMDTIKPIIVLIEFHCQFITNLLRPSYKFYMIGLFNQQEVQVEVHAIKALRYFIGL